MIFNEIWQFNPFFFKYCWKILTIKDGLRCKSYENTLDDQNYGNTLRPQISEMTMNFLFKTSYNPPDLIHLTFFVLFHIFLLFWFILPFYLFSCFKISKFLSITLKDKFKPGVQNGVSRGTPLCWKTRSDAKIRLQIWPNFLLILKDI